MCVEDCDFYNYVQFYIFDLIISCFNTDSVCHIIWDKYELGSRISNIMFFISISVCHVIQDKYELGSRIINTHSHVTLQAITYPVFSFQYVDFLFYPNLLQKSPVWLALYGVGGACGERASRSPSANACTKVKAIKLREWERSSSAFSTYTLFFVIFYLFSHRFSMSSPSRPLR